MHLKSWNKLWVGSNTSKIRILLTEIWNLKILWSSLAILLLLLWILGLPPSALLQTIFTTIAGLLDTSLLKSLRNKATPGSHLMLTFFHWESSSILCSWEGSHMVVKISLLFWNKTEKLALTSILFNTITFHNLPKRFFAICWRKIQKNG